MTKQVTKLARQAKSRAHTPRTQRERRETTRRQLLDAAIECVCTLGYGGATLSVIADQATVTRGAVQHHFGNRNDLFLALIAEISDQLFTLSNWHSLSDKPFAQRLALICDRYWEVVKSRHYVAAVQIQIGSMHDPQLHSEIYKVLRKAETRLDTTWIALFSDLKISPERIISARHVALAALRGMVIRQLYRKSRDGLSQERAMLRHMLTHALSF